MDHVQEIIFTIATTGVSLSTSHVMDFALKITFSATMNVMIQKIPGLVMENAAAKEHNVMVLALRITHFAVTIDVH